jgi:methylmalonyl-CoA/ethylmalonyl-CoA epimerase
LTRAVLDHVAIGAWSSDDVGNDFSRWFGGREVARFSIRSWAGIQMAFAGGIRLEVLEPVENPADDFLQRFLEHRGPGPHHATFKVDDIEQALAELEEVGIEPVKVDLSDPGWREAFLHPALGLGLVVQLAQQGGNWSAEMEPLPETRGAVRAEFLGAELASNLEVAATVFGRVLGGQAEQVADGVAYSWPGAGSLLVRPGQDQRPGVRALVFRYAGSEESPEGPGEEQLFGGPAHLRRLARGVAWPQ